MTLQSGSGRCFSVTGNEIVLQSPGVYYAALSVDVPAQTAVDSVIGLQLNGVPVSPPQLEVVTTATGESTMNYTGSGVFSASAGSVLQVVSSDAFSVPDTTAQPVLSLVLVRLR